MSRTTTIPLDDDVLNPKLAASCFEFLLIELVPTIYRLVADLHAKEEELMTQASRQHLYHGTARANDNGNGDSVAGGTGAVKTLPDRTSLGAVSMSVDSAAGGTAGPTSLGKTGGGTETAIGGQVVDGVEDSESVREAVFFRLDALGYRV